MTGRKKFDVFLSHSSIDKPWVSHLKDALQDRGLRVWLDRDEIRQGKNIQASLAGDDKYGRVTRCWELLNYAERLMAVTRKTDIQS